MQSGSKRRSDEDAENKRPPKKQRPGPSDDVDMRWLQAEITDIKKGIKKISTEAREGREVLNNAIEELLQEVRRRL